MQDQHVYPLPAHIHFGMQEAAVLKTVVRHIGVLVRQNRPAREQSVTMLAVPRNRIAAVHGSVALWRQKISLALAGPLGKKLFFAPIELAHFLQAHQVRVQARYGLA